MTPNRDKPSIQKTPTLYIQRPSHFAIPMTTQLRSLFSHARFSLGVLAFAAIASPCLAALERTGPIDPLNGFPAWYQDKTGVALEMMSPLNDSELFGGWTVLLPGNTTTPEVFPTRFFPEHFYWAGTSEQISYPLPANLGARTGRALLILGLQAGFTGLTVVPGQQLTFTRIRIQLDTIPYSGDYKVYTPFGDFFFPNEIAGNRLRFTQDIGLNPGDFDALLTSSVGPFLIPSASPGGTEMPPVTAANPTPDVNPANFKGVFTPTPYPATGRSYLADPARLGPVTGSTLPKFYRPDGTVSDHNVFRIEGPVIPGTTERFVIETFNFSLQGRVYTGAIPAKVTPTRATYTDSPSGERRIDVFANAVGASSGRIPAANRPVQYQPSLWLYPAPPVMDPLTGTPKIPITPDITLTPIPLFRRNNDHWTQITLPLGSVIPESVVIADASAMDPFGNRVPVYYQRRVTDFVQITSAAYSPKNGGSLTVTARSSDTVLGGPQLSLDGYGSLTNGICVISPLSSIPSRISVSSFMGGSAQLDVQTDLGLPVDPTAPPPVALPPMANDDSMVLLEDQAANSINVLANDSLNAPGTVKVQIISAPSLGSATVNTDGTINYVPNPNANGSDALTYRVSVNGLDSNIAKLSLFVFAVNDAPMATDDSVTGTIGTAALFSPLDNDSDPDGFQDLASILLENTPTNATVNVVSGKFLQVTTAIPGTYSIRYYAVDTGPLRFTLPATVTVKMKDLVSVTSATYTTTRTSLAIVGKAYPGSIVTLATADANGKPIGTLGTAITNTKGAFRLTVTATIPLTATQILATSSYGGVGQLPILRK